MDVPLLTGHLEQRVRDRLVIGGSRRISVGLKCRAGATGRHKAVHADTPRKEVRAFWPALRHRRMAEELRDEINVLGEAAHEARLLGGEAIPDEIPEVVVRDVFEEEAVETPLRVQDASDGVHDAGDGEAHAHIALVAN